jgi:hypothetical protein
MYVWDLQEMTKPRINKDAIARRGVSEKSTRALRARKRPFNIEARDVARKSPMTRIDRPVRHRLSSHPGEIFFAS